MSEFFMTVGFNLLKVLLMTAAMVGGVFAGKGLKSAYDGKKHKDQ